MGFLIAGFGADVPVTEMFDLTLGFQGGYGLFGGDQSDLAWWATPAYCASLLAVHELSCVATGDPAVRSHVLKHELILLQRLASPLAHLLLLETESTIGGGRQLI